MLTALLTALALILIALMAWCPDCWDIPEDAMRRWIMTAVPPYPGPQPTVGISTAYPVTPPYVPPPTRTPSPTWTATLVTHTATVTNTPKPAATDGPQPWQLTMRAMLTENAATLTAMP